VGWLIGRSRVHGRPGNQPRKDKEQQNEFQGVIKNICHAWTTPKHAISSSNKTLFLCGLRRNTFV